MIITKTNLIVFLVGVFLGIATGFFTGKTIYDTPIKEKIERDTVVVTDTVKHYLPTPKDTIRTKYITRYLPVYNTDTVISTDYVTLHDTVQVQVPITQKHYNAKEYDAWISGFEPSLDSIKVYQQTQYITETITKARQRSRWSIGVQAGYGYGFRSKMLEPYAGIGVGLNF